MRAKMNFQSTQHVLHTHKHKTRNKDYSLIQNNFKDFYLYRYLHIFTLYKCFMLLVLFLNIKRHKLCYLKKARQPGVVAHGNSSTGQRRANR